MEKNIDADNYVASPVANQSGSKLFQKEIISGFSRIRIKGALRWTEKNNQLCSFLQTDRQSIDTHQTFMMFCSTSCIQMMKTQIYFLLFCVQLGYAPINWAVTRQNLSSGFLKKRDSSQSPQLQRLARKLKFHL